MQKNSEKSDAKCEIISRIVRLEGSILPVWRMMCHAFTLHFKRWPLPLTTIFALLHLRLHPEDSEPALVADAIYAPRQTVTSILDTLEGLHYLRRVTHEHDRRRICVEITKEGASFADEILRDIWQFEARAMETMKKQDVADMRRHLESYVEALMRQLEDEKSVNA